MVELDSSLKLETIKLRQLLNLGSARKDRLWDSGESWESSAKIGRVLINNKEIPVVCELIFNL